eukprot:Amastigsp_a345486_21.p5 type:complete len:115 gc:universal Amastigsp_a345486_21:1113-769(-)
MSRLSPPPSVIGTEASRVQSSAVSSGAETLASISSTSFCASTRARQLWRSGGSGPSSTNRIEPCISASKSPASLLSSAATVGRTWPRAESTWSVTAASSTRTQQPKAARVVSDS